MSLVHRGPCFHGDIHPRKLVVTIVDDKTCYSLAQLCALRGNDSDIDVRGESAIIRINDTLLTFQVPTLHYTCTCTHIEEHHTELTSSEVAKSCTHIH